MGAMLLSALVTPTDSDESAVILVGAWSAIGEQAIVVRIAQTTLYRVPVDLRAVRNTAMRVHPAWLLLGEGIDDEMLARIASAVRGILPGMRLAVLGPADDIERCERWVRSGTRVYLAASTSPERLVAALRDSVTLDAVITDAGLLRAALAQQAELRASLLAAGGLSRQELDILHLIQRGRRNADIAAELHLSEKTVEGHVRNLLSKLGVTNRTEAAQRARILGL